MRPKKRILIASSFETRLSVLRFMLTTNGRAVSTATYAAEALAQLRAYGCDLLLIDLPFFGYQSLIDQVNVPGWHQPVIGLLKRTDMPEAIGFDAMLPRDYSPAELLDRIRVMTACKRGPKPQKKPVLSVPAIAAAGEVVNL
jgi:DNA-binding response OmpR family regulator